MLTEVTGVTGTRYQLVTKSTSDVIWLSFFKVTITVAVTVTHVNSYMQSKSRNTLRVGAADAIRNTKR